MDVENLQLIDRLHTMSSEIAFLKTTINEKEKQGEELHRALEDKQVLESSMRGEIEQQHVRSEELELGIQSLQVLRSPTYLELPNFFCRTVIEATHCNALL